MVIDNINVISQIVTDRYALYNGDSCEVLKGIPDNSIHYSIFSRLLQAFTRTQIARETWETAEQHRNFMSSLCSLFLNCTAYSCQAD